MRVRYLIGAVLIVFAFSAFAAANGDDWEPPIGPDYADNPPASEHANLKDVRKYYKESSYAWAAAAARYYSENYPKGISRPEVEYILVKCMLQTQEYEGVLDKLEFIMKKYPRSFYAIDAADMYVDLFSDMNEPYYYWDWSTYLYGYLGIDDYYDYDNKKMLRARENALNLAEKTYKNHMKSLSGSAQENAADRNVFNHMLMMPYLGLDDYDDEAKTYKNYDKYIANVEKKEMSLDMKSVLAFYRGFIYASMYPIDGDLWEGTDQDDFYQWQIKKRFEVAENHWHNVAAEYPDILGGIVAKAAIAHYKVVLYNNPEEAAIEFDELSSQVKTDYYREYLQNLAEDLRGPGLLITSVVSDPTGAPQLTVNMGAKGYDEVEMTLYPVDPKFYYKASGKLYAVDIYLKDGRIMRTDGELWYDYGEGEKVDEIEIDRIEPRPTGDLPGVGKPVESWTVATRYADDLRVSSFEATLDDVDPGMYIIEAKTDDGNISRSLFLHSKVSAVTTYDNHDFFFQLSGSEYGEPVTITGVTAYNIVYEPDDRGYNREQYKDVDLITRKSGDGYLANMDKLKESTTVYLVLESEDGPALTSFYTPYSYNEDTYETGLVYTDKPMYLPEQTVNYKVILRKVDYIEKALAPLPGTKISLRLTSPDGSELWTGEEETDGFGTLWGSVELPPGAMLGSYYLYANWSRGEGEEKRDYSANGYFSLEEYEKPEYEMFIETERDRYLSGEDVRLNITGKYYFGAPMADSTVEYEVTRSGYNDKEYEYDKLVKKGEAKTDAEGQFVLEWPTKYAGEYDNSYNVYVKITDPSNHEIEEWYYVYTYRNDRFVSISTDKYDYHRDEAIEVDLSTYDWYNDYLSMPVGLKVYEYWYDDEDYEYKTGELLYETATVTDSEGLGEVIVELANPPAMVLLETRIEDTVGTEVLTSTSVNFIAEDIETTERVPELEITVDEWYPELGDTINAKVRSRFEGVTAGVLFFSNDFQSYKNVILEPDPDGGYSASFPITLEDRYLPQLQLKANLFHERIYYSNDTYVYITNTNTQMDVTVEVEKDEYTTSDDSAKVTVTTESPYGNPIIANLSLAAVDEALLALRYDQTEHLPNQFPNMLHRYSYPYITHSLYELGEMNTTNYKFLNYSGVSFYRAYDEDAEGSRAVELLYKYSLPYMVDDDVAIYLNYGSFNSLDATYYDRVTGWGIGDLMGGMARESGGMGGLGSGATGAAGEMAPSPTMKSMSRMSVSEEESDAEYFMANGKKEKSKDGAFGFDDFDGNGLLMTEGSPEDKLATTTIGGKTYAKAELREFFTDLAFWKPDLITDSDGKTSAEIELPDNLTDWKVMALAVDKGQRIGWGYDGFNVTKNVIVRLKAPRHLVVGDTALIKNMAHNYLEEKKDVLFVTGSDQLELIKGDTEKNKMIDPDGKDFVELWFKATDPGTARIEAFAGTDVESDATYKDIPVFPHGIVQRQAWAGRLRDTVSHDLTLADAIDPATFKGEIIMSPSLAKTLSHGLDYYEEYPYDCVEQTMNRFLINALLADAAGKLGLDESVLSEGLSESIDLGITRLEEQQTSDGGWPWWKGGQPSPYMTAYALDGLYTLKGNPFVSETANGKLDNMIIAGSAYLVSYIDSLEGDPNRYDWELSLYIAEVALRHGIVPGNYDILRDALDYYFESRNPLSDRSLVLLGTVAHYMGDEAKVGTVLRNLDNGAQIGLDQTMHWGKEPMHCWYWWDDAVETTAKVLDLKMLTQHNSPQIPFMVDWMVDERRGAVWKSTKDSAEATKTLMRYLINYPEVTEPIIISYLLNEATGGLELDPLAFESPDETAELKLEDFYTGDNSLTINRDRGEGPVFYTVAVEYFTEADYTPAVKGSVTIDRDYYLVKRFEKKGKMEEKRVPLDRALKVGEEMEVEVTITSPYDFDYVVVEDPRPAGCIYTEYASGYNWWLDAFVELRTEKRVVMFERLDQGETVYSYRLKAEVPGDFAALPASIKGMYSPDIGSTTESTRVEVKE